MGRNSQLIKNTFIIFVGKFFTQFFSFILVPIYTNFLSTNDYGYVDIVQTYISLLVPILVLRFDSAIFRFLIDERNNDDKKKETISSTFVFLIAQIFLFITFYLLVLRFVSFQYSFAIFLNIIFMSFSSILLQTCRGLGDNVGYSIGSIIAGVVTILLNFYFIVYLKLDGSFILISSAIANAFCSVFLIFRNKIISYINFKKINYKKTKEMIKYSIPMIPDNLSWWVINASDRTLISFFINFAANGIYAVSCKFSNILTSAFLIFNMSWQESASLHINDSDCCSFFSNVFNKTYKIIYSICLEIMVFIPIVFKLFVGNEYLSSYVHIPILLLGNLYSSLANMYGGIYVAKKNTKSVAKTTILAAVINLIIDVILIQKLGLFAASISTFVSYLFLLLYRSIDSKKYVKIREDKKTMIYTNLFFIISSLIYYFYFNNLTFVILNIILSNAVIICLNYSTLKKILKRK